MKKILAMTSTVTSKGQTVVPKALQERLNIKPGTSLDWQEDGQSLRVVKLEPRKAGSFLTGLRRLGRVPAGPRNKRVVNLTIDDLCPARRQQRGVLLPSRSLST